MDSILLSASNRLLTDDARLTARLIERDDQGWLPAPRCDHDDPSGKPDWDYWREPEDDETLGPIEIGQSIGLTAIVSHGESPTPEWMGYSTTPGYPNMFVERNGTVELPESSVGYCNDFLRGEGPHHVEGLTVEELGEYLESCED